MPTAEEAFAFQFREFVVFEVFIICFHFIVVFNLLLLNKLVVGLSHRGSRCRDASHASENYHTDIADTRGVFLQGKNEKNENGLNQDASQLEHVVFLRERN